MMKLNRMNFFAAFVMLTVLGGCNLVASKVMGQKAHPAVKNNAATQQPIYSEYKGVRLGMTDSEVRSKLGDPAMKSDELDYYLISTNEAVQIAYDTAHKAKIISIDYTGGVGAPDPKTVVGGELEESPKGLYKCVRYEHLGFWVSYNRTTGTMTVVTVTIQKI